MPHGPAAALPPAADPAGGELFTEERSAEVVAASFAGPRTRGCGRS